MRGLSGPVLCGALVLAAVLRPHAGDVHVGDHVSVGGHVLTDLIPGWFLAVVGRKSFVHLLVW